MKDNFKSSIEWLFIDETGAESKAVPGQPLKVHAISAKHLALWTGRIGNRIDELSRVDAVALLRAHVWNEVGADNLESGLDYWCFDTCYRFGGDNCRRWLNLALGLDAHRKTDPAVIAACKAKMTTRDIILQMDVLVRRRLKVDPQWEECKHWWTNRTNRARDRAVKLSQVPVRV